MRIETREFTTELEIRGDGRTIVGRCVPYGEETRVGNFVEVFHPGAFRDAVPAEVSLTASHPRDGGELPIGVAVSLEDRVDGCYITGRVSKTRVGDEILELVRDKALKGLSIGFLPDEASDRWSRDRGRVDRYHAHLDHVAIVRRPAYAGAQIAAVRATLNEEDVMSRGARRRAREEVPAPLTREQRAVRIDELEGWLKGAVRDDDAEAFDANARELEAHQAVMAEFEQRDVHLRQLAAAGHTEDGWDPGPTHARRDAGEHWSARREDPSYVPLLRADESMVEYLKDRGRPVGSEEFRLALLGALGSGNTRALGRLARFLPEGEEVRDMLISSGGNATLTPDVVSAELIDQLRRQAVTQLLGGRTMPMTSDTQKIPRITADPTVSWLAEGATVTATDATVDSVSLVARRLTGLTKVSQELVEDSDPVSVGEVLRTSFGGALAVEVDRVALKGTGTPPEPQGIRNQSGVSVNATAAAASMAVVTERAGVLLAANVRPDSIGVAANTTSYTTIMSATGSDGQFIRPPKFLENIQILPTTALAGPATGELYAGNFSELIFGVRLALDFQVLRERYLDEGKIGFLPRIRMDVAVRHGASFALRTALSS